jgi:ArsR family transcriptional regulator, arsenate/arsenite/antimonite-responsive transcriptional repressor
MELLFRALADRTRLRLLNLMSKGEVCVCFLVEILSTNQPKISRHLAYLRRAGIVAARREGKWMHYRLSDVADEQAAQILNNVLAWLATDVEMARDLAKLAKICCAISLPVRLQAAPRPVNIVAEPQHEAGDEDQLSGDSGKILIL